MSVEPTSIEKTLQRHHIIIYDGVCNFCNGAIHFIIRRDPAKIFVFTPMQTQLAQDLIKKHNIENVGRDTFLLIKDGTPYTYTKAALEIMKDLKGFWLISRIFQIIPNIFRDFVYKALARNRYSLFGRTQKCRIPSADEKSRFLDLQSLTDD